MSRTRDNRVRRSRRLGFSLVEVIVALGILAGALLGMSAFGVKLAQGTTIARIKATAGQLVSDRLETIKGAPTYTSIDSLYPGTESPVSGFPGFTRQTWVSHVGGKVTDTVDYRLITVEVRHAKLPTPVRKTDAIPPF